MRRWINETFGGLTSSTDAHPMLAGDGGSSDSNEAHREDFDFAHAVDFSHLGFKGVSETFAVVHLDVNLDELETKGQRLGLNGLNVVVVIAEGRNRFGDGVRVDVFEIGIRVHLVCHHYHTHAITSGTNEPTVRALVQHALVSHTGASANGIEASRAGEGGRTFFCEGDA